MEFPRFLKKKEKTESISSTETTTRMPKGEGQPKYVYPEGLAKQFKATEIYTMGGTTIEAFDVQPEKLKTEIPVFFGTGWSASRGVYEAGILGIAEQGRRVLSLFAPHGVDTDPEFGKGNNTYPASELRKAIAMLHVLVEKDVSQVDVVAHSESAMWTLIVAMMHPEKIRNIVLIDPAGLIGDDTLKRLATGFSLDLIRNTLNEEKLARPEVTATFRPGNATDTLGALQNMFSNPLHSVREVLAIRDADIRDMLGSLREQGKHISIIQGARDTVFPMEQMQNIVKKDMVDGFYSVYGGHNEFNLNPNAYVHVTDIALDGLENLNKIEQKEKESR